MNLRGSLFCKHKSSRGKSCKVLLPEKELIELPGNIPSIFFRNLILIAICKDQVQHSATGKWSIVDNFCDAEFLAYYTLENKYSKTAMNMSLMN